jgi:threonine/homoserine/homoserine lactone efflux protein
LWGAMPCSSTLAVYVVTATLVLLVPGPAVLCVVSRGVRHGSQAGITAALRMHAGTLVQVAVGLSWLVASSASAFTVIKYVGAAYLIYLGVRAVLRRSARFLRGERYVVGCTFIGLGVAAALTPGQRNR